MTKWGNAEGGLWIAEMNHGIWGVTFQVQDIDGAPLEEY
jgi:hypothetical protein